MPTTYEIDVKYGFIDIITGGNIEPNTLFITEDKARFFDQPICSRRDKGKI